MNLSVTASLVFNQYVNPIAWDALNWKYYIICTSLPFACFSYKLLIYIVTDVVWDVLEFIFMWLYAIETKGRTLEECSLLFDGKDASLQATAEQDVAGLGHADEKHSVRDKEETHTP